MHSEGKSSFAPGWLSERCEALSSELSNSTIINLMFVFRIHYFLKWNPIIYTLLETDEKCCLFKVPCYKTGLFTAMYSTV
jgi:hypothetical protein